MPPGDSAAAPPPLLRSATLHPRRIFLHFFDLHFLEERNLAAKQNRAVAEMELATRFAVMVAARIYVPAASFYENEIARRVLLPFLNSEVGSLFTLVGSGSSVEEFKAEKLTQYKPGSLQHQIYSSTLEQDAAWGKRRRSATGDIIANWSKALEHDDVLAGFGRLRDQAVTEGLFERMWYDIPERLNGQAFIVEHVAPLLPFPSDSRSIIALNGLHGIINREYFRSYAQDYNACVFQNLIFLGNEPVPSLAPQDDIHYDALVKACRIAGVLEQIRAVTPGKLEDLSGEPRFVEAFRGSQVAGPITLPTREEPSVDSSVTVPASLASAIAAPLEVDLGIVTALPKEREAVEGVFGKGRLYKVPGDPHLYKLVELEVAGKKRMIAIGTPSDMGNARAAVTAADMLRTFKPRLIAMVGIAGGCPNPTDLETHIRLGDVVISDKIFEYDHVKRIAGGKIEHRDSPQRIGYQWLQAARQLMSEVTGFSNGWLRAYKAGLRKFNLKVETLPSDILHGVDGSIVPHPEDPRRKKMPRLVHIGHIAAGDTLLKDPALRDQLRDASKVRAVEMEGSGVRDAAWSRTSELVVVRGIVDYCDTHKTNDWHMAAAVAAAAVTRLLYETLIQAESNG